MSCLVTVPLNAFSTGGGTIGNEVTVEGLRISHPVLRGIAGAIVRHNGVYTVDFGFGPGLAAKSVKRGSAAWWINQISLERIDRCYSGH